MNKTFFVGSAIDPDFHAIPLSSLHGALTTMAVVVEAENAKAADALVKEWHQLAERRLALIKLAANSTGERQHDSCNDRCSCGMHIRRAKQSIAHRMAEICKS